MGVQMVGEIKKNMGTGSIKVNDYREKENVCTGEDFEFMVWKEGLHKNLQSFWKIMSE